MPTSLASNQSAKATSAATAIRAARLRVTSELSLATAGPVVSGKSGWVALVTLPKLAEVPDAFVVAFLLIVVVGFAEEVVAVMFRRPLQAPAMQTLNAHCEFEEQGAWKFPHTGINIELEA